MNYLHENLSHNLNCILIADKLLNPDKFLCQAEKWKFSVAISRNLTLIDIFPEIFGKPETLLSVDDNDPEVKKIYSNLLNYEQDQLWHLPASLHESRIAATISRKKQGAYYTPPYIIKYMVDSSLNNLFKTHGDLSVNRLKIIDPACGGGSFLIETYKALVCRGLSADEAIGCIYGTDIDKDATSTAIFVLTLVALTNNSILDPLQIKSRWEKQVIAGDALNPIQSKSIFAEESITPNNFINWPVCFPEVFSIDSPGFDIVIGNPPYVSNKLIPLEQKKLFKEGFTTALGQFDLSVLFFEQGISLLKDKGIASYITSNKFMAADYGKNLRKKLLESCEIIEMVDVSTLKCFKNTAVYPVIISFRKQQPCKNFTVCLFKLEAWNELKANKPVVINQGFFSNDREFILTTQLTDKIVSIVEKIGKAGDRIPEQKIRCGLAETGFNKWVAPRGDNLHEDLFHPFIQSGHIESFYIKDPDFIDKTKIKSDRFIMSSGPKLVIPGMSKKLKAAVDFSDSLMGRVYFVREHDTKYDLDYLAVLLNSFVLNFYYKVMYWPVHLEGGYLRFNSTYLANLPLYSIDNSGQEKESTIHAISQIGSILNSTNIDDSGFAEMRCEAEALTFLLYDMSEHDISIIMDFLEVQVQVRDRVTNYFEKIKGGSIRAGKENSKSTDIQRQST